MAIKMAGFLTYGLMLFFAFPISQWLMKRSFPTTVAGTVTDLTVFPFTPEGHHQAQAIL